MELAMKPGDRVFHFGWKRAGRIAEISRNGMIKVDFNGPSDMSWFFPLELDLLENGVELFMETL
jgi:transcription elongation factor GreA-like protein